MLATYSAQVPWLLAAGVLRQNISVVPYGVDIDHFTPDGGRADKRLPQRVVAFGDVARPSGFGTAVAALRWLLAHPAMREQQGAAGCDRAVVRYCWHRIAAETMHAYRRAGVTDPAVLTREADEAARKRRARRVITK